MNVNIVRSARAFAAALVASSSLMGADPALARSAPKHMVVLRVVTADWVPNQYGTASWEHAVTSRGTSTFQWFEAAIWSQRNTVHLYKFDAAFDPLRVSTMPESEWIAYREGYRLAKVDIPAGASDAEKSRVLRDAFKQFFAAIVADTPAQHYGIRYSGHGSGTGGLFQNQITSADARLLWEYATALIGRKLDFIDFGGNCTEGTATVATGVHPFFDFIVASDLPIGGYTLDEWTIERFLETDADAQFPALFVPGRTIRDALVSYVGLQRRRWEHSRNGMTADRVTQALSLYDASRFAGLAALVRAVPSAAGVSPYEAYNYDLYTFIKSTGRPDLESQFLAFRTHYASNKDFFAWPVDSNGLRIYTTADLGSDAGTTPVPAPTPAPTPTPSPSPGSDIDALPVTWNLPEGSTGFFHERIAVANPGTTDAAFTLTLLPESGAPVALSYTLPAQRRRTIVVNDLPGFASAAASAIVTSTSGRVVVERTMMWDAPGAGFYGGHTGKGIPAAATTWYLAEGEASFFDTYILLANAEASPATVTLAFLLENGTTIVETRAVAGNSRTTVYANDVPGLRGKAFSTTITSTVPITVERAMYFGSGVRTFNGGHGTAAVAAPATSWFVAEGRTGTFFDTYLLLANPGAAPATVTINFLKPGGATVAQTRTLNATSRTTIHVDSVPGLEDTDVSASIASTQPIIVERAMYWPDPFSSWAEAHAAAGVTATGAKWALAEGEVGGALGFETYILLANPNALAATVTLTFLRASAPPITLTRTVAPNGRLTVSAGEAGLGSGEQFGMLVDSTQPIAVERAMYWNGLGQFWSAGTNETGVRIQ